MLHNSEFNFSYRLHISEDILVTAVGQFDLSFVLPVIDICTACLFVFLFICACLLCACVCVCVCVYGPYLSDSNKFYYNLYSADT